MSSRWWQLPGPASFVSNVVSAWGRGRHTILWLPNGMYPGLRQACRTELEREGHGHWAARIDLLGRDGRPLEILRQDLAPNLELGLAGISDLLINSTARGAVVWVDGVGQDSWVAWHRVLSDIEAASRALELAERTVLCVAVEALPENLQPPADVCLEVMKWSHVVDSIDALIFAASLCSAQRRSDDDRMLRTLTIAHLALWDGLSAEMLADLPNDRLCDPVEPLREFAAGSSWNIGGAEPCWQSGSADVWHGRRTLHSAWLAAREGAAELRRRHWKAQVQALLPYVDEQRVQLLERVRGRLKVPYVTSTGDVVTSIENLEIGHIYSQLSQDSYVAFGLRKKIRILKDIRNALSHLDPLPSGLLFDRALEGRFDRG